MPRSANAKHVKWWYISQVGYVLRLHICLLRKWSIHPGFASTNQVTYNLISQSIRALYSCPVLEGMATHYSQHPFYLTLFRKCLQIILVRCPFIKTEYWYQWSWLLYPVDLYSDITATFDRRSVLTWHFSRIHRWTVLPACAGFFILRHAIFVICVKYRLSRWLINIIIVTFRVVVVTAYVT